MSAICCFDGFETTLALNLPRENEVGNDFSPSDLPASSASAVN
jgi:hypothetical protein